MSDCALAPAGKYWYKCADMATVGEQLKAAREAQRLTVTQVADVTKIRSDHIRAIDSGNYDVFSAPVYIRGFVRTYAMALKLDPAQILAQLNLELAEAGCQTQPPFQAHASGILDSAMFHVSTAGRRMVLPVIAGVLLLVGAASGWLLWNHYQKRSPLAGLGPGLYQAQPDPGETLPLPPPRR
jgi:cytoskeletal protein RodZ